MKDIFLKLMFNILKDYMNVLVILLEKMKIEKVVVAKLHDEMNMLYT